MKWEPIKERIASLVYDAISQSRDWETDSIILVDLLSTDFGLLKNRDSYELKVEYAKKAADVINKWDIRMARKLFDLFPDYAPKSLRNKQLFAEYDNDGDWAIFAN